jgi:hypothetical protein
VALRYAAHTLDVLASNGPGNLARGWNDERRYARVKNTKLDQFPANAIRSAAKGDRTVQDIGPDRRAGITISGVIRDRVELGSK